MGRDVATRDAGPARAIAKRPSPSRRRPPLRWPALALVGSATLTAARGASGADASPAVPIGPDDLRGATPPALTAVSSPEVVERYGRTLVESLQKAPALKTAIGQLDPAFVATVTGERGRAVGVTGPWQDNRAVRGGGREFLLMSGCRVAHRCDATSYVIAVDGSARKVALVKETERPHSYLLLGDPDPVLRSVLLALAGKELNEGQGPPIAAAPAAVPSDPLFPGLPSDANCHRAREDARITPTTQLDMNRVASAKRTLAECELGATYRDLLRTGAANAETSTKLAGEHRSWQAFVGAHLRSRFPPRDEPAYYGSILPLCEDSEGETLAQARTREVAGEGSCHDGPETQAAAREGARLADAALNDAYRKVRAAHAGDAAFLTALQQAEIAWLQFRDARVGFAGVTTGGSGSPCALRALERVTRARTEQLQLWLTARAEEGDGCAGTYGAP